MSKKEQPIYLVYDGECPLCQAFARLLKIREAAGELELIDARSAHPILAEINTLGFNLDEGIVLKFNQNFYYGADALHLLALLSTNKQWFNRLNAVIFRSVFLSKLIYPFLKALRNLLRWYHNIPKINNLKNKHEC